MLAVDTSSSACTLTLTGEERSQLLTFLEHALRTKQVEAHRTKTINYREHLEHEEALLQGLIDKLRRA